MGESSWNVSVSGPLRAGIVSAIPDLALGIAFLAAWWVPGWMQPNSMLVLMVILLLEFINMHSSAFLGMVWLGPQSRVRKLATMVCLSLFYTAFVAAFSVLANSLWPVLAFWGLTANRMLATFLDPAPAEQRRLRIRATWAACAVCFLGAIFAGVILPIPRMGWLPGSNLRDLAHAGGLWVDQPWRMLCTGALYYIAMGISEWHDHRWLRLHPGPAPAAALHRVPAERD